MTAITAKNRALVGLFGMLVILLLGYGLRIQNLNVYPTGLSSDEAGDSIDGLQISQHGVYPLYEDIDRSEPLHQIIIAVGVDLFGPSIFVIRLLDVWIGVLTIAAACWAARQCVPDWSPEVRWLVGLTAAAILAVSLGHITLSRSIYRGILQPPSMLLFMGFLLRGIQTKHRRDFIVAGVWLGSAMYTYTAAYSVPLAIVAVVMSLILFQRAHWRQWLPGLIAFGIVFMLISSPLIGRVLTIRQSVLGRATDVSGPVTTNLSARIDRLIISFINAGEGDGNPQYNTASAPLLPPLWGDIFIVGLGVLIIRVRLPSSAILGALLIAEAIPVLASNEVPHGLRIVGEYAVYPIITALAVGLVGFWLMSWSAELRANLRIRRTISRILQPIGVLVLVGVIAGDGIWAYQTYVNFWPNTGTYNMYGRSIPTENWFFRTDRKTLAEWITAQSGPMLMPADELNEATTRAWLMVKYPITTTMPVASDQTAISLPAGTHLVVSWSLELGDLRRATRQYVLLNQGAITVLPPFTESSHATLLADIDNASPIYDTDGTLLGRVKPLSAAPMVAVDPRLTSIAGLPTPIFDNNVSLIGWHGPDTLQLNGSATTLTYTLDWQPHVTPDHYYSAYLQVQTADYQRIAGDDVVIWRWLYPSSIWQSGDVVPDTHMLTIPANLPAGAYRLAAGLYVFAQLRSPAVDDKGGSLGTNVTVGWIKVPAPPDTINPDLPKVDALFGNTFHLLAAGITTPKDNQVTVTLQWQSNIRRPPIDATIFVHLVDANGKLIAQQDARPKDGHYPTFIWDANEVVTTTYRLTLPSEVDLNSLHLQIGMYTFPSLSRLPVTQNDRTITNGIFDLDAINSLKK